MRIHLSGFALSGFNVHVDILIVLYSAVFSLSVNVVTFVIGLMATALKTDTRAKSRPMIFQVYITIEIRKV